MDSNPSPQRIAFDISPRTWFVLIGMLLAVQSSLFQPIVNYYSDFVRFRDGGFFLAHLLSLDLSPIWTFISFMARALDHGQGPLQLIIQNLYYLLLGEWVGMSPAVTVLPNALFFCLAAYALFLIGKRLGSERFGWSVVLLFLTAPGFALMVRKIVYAQSLSPMLSAAALYAYIRLADNPRDRIFRWFAPGLMALYLLAALDWPAFSAALALFLLLSGSLRETVFKNPFTLLPVAVILMWVAWILYLDHNNATWASALLVRPFLKAESYMGASLSTVWNQTVLPLGVLLPLGAAGLVSFAMGMKKPSGPLSVENAFFIAVGFWGVTTATVTLKSSANFAYIFVTVVPLSLLAARVVERWSRKSLTIVFAALYIGQWGFTITRGYPDYLILNSDIRVLAAADYILENRQDFLDEEKVSFLPRNKAANVGQHVRGRQERIVMPPSFPVTRKTGADGSSQEVLETFMNEHEKSGRLPADWLVIEGELLKPGQPWAPYFKGLTEDNHVNWLVRIVDGQGRDISVGERSSVSRPLKEAPVLSAEPLADHYRDHYDRTTFMRRNLDRIDLP